MRIVGFVVLSALLWLANETEAGSFTVSTSAAHDAVIQRKVDQINAQITEQNRQNAAYNAANPREPQKTISPVMTRDAYLAEVWRQAMDALVQEWRATMPSLTERWKTMTDADKAAICTRLGVTECPR